MLQYLKKEIQKVKIKQCQSRQEAELAKQKDRYAQWILQNELPKAFAAKTEMSGDQIQVIDYREIDNAYPFQNWESEILVFADLQAGELDARALPEIVHLFQEHADWDFIYGDEDYQCGQRRIAPWMKPQWSPDTLLSFPYIGNYFALRRQKYATVRWLEHADFEEKIYDFLLKCAGKRSTPVHVPKVLFHNRITKVELSAYERLEQDSRDRDHPMEITADENMPWGLRFVMHRCEEQFDRVRLEAVKRLGFTGRIEPDENGIRQIIYDIKPDEKADAKASAKAPEKADEKASALADTLGNMPLVSIIIPSKDNVEVLKRCLTSIREHSAYEEYEILVVDNGSTGATRATLMNLAEKLKFRFFYQPMEFNFSAMVNYGVRQAKGSYVLLLNDDCEILQDDWLVRMLGQAQLPHVGAVGAKLLYPQSDLIQHAGITNMTVGPAHKLQAKTDSVSYYYGRNRMNYDHIGVTAACLLVAKEKYEQAGGFDESIRVAFNDVDFCFRLIEQGYYNVMRNDVVLYHYESLSRGNDLLSEEKMERMLSERDKIYQKHPQFRGKDPFYSENLLGNAVDYLVNYHYAYENEDCFTQISPFQTEILQEWYNDSIFVTMEHCSKDRFLEIDERDFYYKISGWAYVLGQDNCRYEMSLLLQEEQSGAFYQAEVYRYWRPDVEQILPEQIHVELTGFIARLRSAQIQAGKYHIYVFMEDACSRQKLLKDTGEVLEVRHDEK